MDIFKPTVDYHIHISSIDILEQFALDICAKINHVRNTQVREPNIPIFCIANHEYMFNDQVVNNLSRRYGITLLNGFSFFIEGGVHVVLIKPGRRCHELISLISNEKKDWILSLIKLLFRYDYKFDINKMLKRNNKRLEEILLYDMVYELYMSGKVESLQQGLNRLIIFSNLIPRIRYNPNGYDEFSMKIRKGMNEGLKEKDTHLALINPNVNEWNNGGYAKYSGIADDGYQILPIDCIISNEPINAGMRMKQCDMDVFYGSNTFLLKNRKEIVEPCVKI
ncbi:MAG: hypothetical protein ACOCQD_00390 [archaeon]